MQSLSKNRAWMLIVGAGLATAAATAQTGDRQGERGSLTRGGRADMYRHLDEDSLEDVSSPKALRNVLTGNSAPTRIWKTLEHGEKVECLDCIPLVSKLLYDTSPENREIGAWWLRRRIFGVFGPGEVYSQLVSTLEDAGASETRRAYAAEAIGEFLISAGVAPVAKAVVTDTSPKVRTSAVRALVRLNTEGPAQELGQALSDKSEEVRLAAVEGAYHVHVFTSVDSLTALIGDESARVRRRAAEGLGALKVGDAVLGLMRLTEPKNEDDTNVRLAAVAALGRIADPDARGAVKAALSDPDGFVRDAARIALRRL